MIHFTSGVTLALLAIAKLALAAPEIVFPADSGVIDVTKPPYNAKGNGVHDDTEAINRALRDHNQANAPDPFMSWTIYLPKGTYLISDTIQPRDPGGKSQCTVRLTGEGVSKSVIRLKNSAPGFGKARRPKVVVATGNKNGGQPNSGYGNYIENLTVDVGANNPGAIGVRFDVANCGAMSHVAIKSSDPARRGYAGLGFFSVCGLGYVKDLSVEGFDYGVYFDRTPVNNIALDRIKLARQRISGIYNVGKNIQVWGLTSSNRVPALRVEKPWAATLLASATLAGEGAGPAVEMQSTSFLSLRDVEIKGYGKAVRKRGADDLPVGKITEWMSQTGPLATDLTKERSLHLPVKDAPEFYDNDLTHWANVTAFGATRDDNTDDDATGIQKAIDSGRAIVYFPRGTYTLKTEVVVRGPVRKIDFFFCSIKSAPDSQGGFRVREVEHDSVLLENMSMLAPITHDSSKSVVIRNHGKGGAIKTGPLAKGDLFVENAGPHVAIEVANGVHAWLRAINRERAPFLNDGSTVWYFADNTERMKTRDTGKLTIGPIKTINGGKTELVGGALDALWVKHSPDDGALIECINSTVSATYAGEVRKRDGQWGSWPIQIREVQGTETRIVKESDVLMTDVGWGSHLRRFVMPLYRSKPISPP